MDLCPLCKWKTKLKKKNRTKANQRKVDMMTARKPWSIYCFLDPFNFTRSNFYLSMFIIHAKHNVRINDHFIHQKQFYSSQKNIIWVNFVSSSDIKFLWMKSDFMIFFYTVALQNNNTLCSQTWVDDFILFHKVDMETFVLSLQWIWTRVFPNINHWRNSSIVGSIKFSQVL